MAKANKNKGIVNKKLKATTSKVAESNTAKVESTKPMLFTKTNYMTMLLGIGFMFLGFVLMAGGQMPSPDVWEPERIYSTTRTLIAPILILIGLGIQGWAIFRK